MAGSLGWSGAVARRRRSGIVGVCAAVGVIVAGASYAAAQTTDDAAGSIAAASASFSRAYMAGDTATIRALYTEDGMLLPPERTVEGRDAITRYFAPGSRRENTHHAMVSERLEVTGDVAVDVGTWHNRWRIDGGEERTASGAYLVVWRRGADGRWRIQYDAWHRPPG